MVIQLDVIRLDYDVRMADSFVHLLRWHQTLFTKAINGYCPSIVSTHDIVSIGDIQSDITLVITGS